MRYNTLILISCAALSLPAIGAQDQDRCKPQAIPAVDTIRWLSNSDIGVTEIQKAAAKEELKKLEQLLSEQRYCEALKLATTADS